MKLKIFSKVLCCSLFVSTLSLANAQDKPQFMFFHFNKSNADTMNLDPLKRSFSIKNEEKYCWMTEIPTHNMKDQSIKIVEKFITPAAGHFGSSDDLIIESNADKTLWTITQNVPMAEIKEQDGVYIRCWVPSKEDPVGKFTLEVTAGNTTFPAVRFALTE